MHIYVYICIYIIYIYISGYAVMADCDNDFIYQLPRTLVSYGRIHQSLKTSYTSSLRSHTLVAEGLIH